MDPNAANKVREYEDVSQIEKYMMSEEEYDKLPGMRNNLNLIAHFLQIV